MHKQIEKPKERKNSAEFVSGTQRKLKDLPNRRNLKIPTLTDCREQTGVVRQRIINVDGDNLLGKGGAKKLLTNNKIIPGSVSQIRRHLTDMHADQTHTYSTFQDIARKIYRIQGMTYVGIVNKAAVDMRLENPDAEFSENYLETGSMRAHSTLADLGILVAGDIQKWFLQHDEELNQVIESVYLKMDKKEEENIRALHKEWKQELPEGMEFPTQPRDTRKGLCGQTSNAVLRYLGINYPALFAIGKIQQQGREEHQFLVFENADIETVLVDPTYRQFDKKGEWTAQSHIWVGNPEDHPFPNETADRIPSNLNLKLL